MNFARETINPAQKTTNQSGVQQHVLLSLPCDHAHCQVVSSSVEFHKINGARRDSYLQNLDVQVDGTDSGDSESSFREIMFDNDDNESSDSNVEHYLSTTETNFTNDALPGVDDEMTPNDELMEEYNIVLWFVKLFLWWQPRFNIMNAAATLIFKMHQLHVLPFITANSETKPYYCKSRYSYNKLSLTPFKEYVFKKPSQWITELLQSKEFRQLLTLHAGHIVSDNMEDIWDGHIWQEFLKRLLKKWICVVGIIPGPTEPKVRRCAVDPMHALLLGLVKKEVTIILDPENNDDGNCLIKDHNKLKSRLKSTVLPSDCGRLPTNIL
eukprot:gene14801-16338_t